MARIFSIVVSKRVLLSTTENTTMSEELDHRLIADTFRKHDRPQISPGPAGAPAAGMTAVCSTSIYFYEILFLRWFTLKQASVGSFLAIAAISGSSSPRTPLGRSSRSPGSCRALNEVRHARRGKIEAKVTRCADLAAAPNRVVPNNVGPRWGSSR
jgi:hypothetical protein